jgi:hypothetical protein
MHKVAKSASAERQLWRERAMHPVLHGVSGVLIFACAPTVDPIRKYQYSVGGVPASPEKGSVGVVIFISKRSVAWGPTDRAPVQLRNDCTMDTIPPSPNRESK